MSEAIERKLDQIIELLSEIQNRQKLSDPDYCRAVSYARQHPMSIHLKTIGPTGGKDE